MSSVRIPQPEPSILTRLLVSEVQRKIDRRSYHHCHRFNRGRPASARIAIRAEARAAHRSDVCLRQHLLRGVVRNACIDVVKQRVAKPATTTLTYTQVGAYYDNAGQVQTQTQGEIEAAAAEEEMAAAEQALAEEEEAEAAAEKFVAEQQVRRERVVAFVRDQRAVSSPLKWEEL